jgi:hypothetical protein
MDMARQANLFGIYADEAIDSVTRFAKLVAKHEREACAKLFDDRNTGTGFYEPHEPAEIIRARGNHEET